MATPGEREKDTKSATGRFPEAPTSILEKANEATAKSGYRRDRKSSYHDPIYVRQYNASRRECSKSYNYHEQEHKS